MEGRVSGDGVVVRVEWVRMSVKVRVEWGVSDGCGIIRVSDGCGIIHWQFFPLGKVIPSTIS